MTTGRDDLLCCRPVTTGTPGRFVLVVNPPPRHQRLTAGPRAPRLSALRDPAGFELASPLAAGWGMEVGMTIDILRAGLKIEEVEIELRHRATGRDLAAQLHRAKQLRDVTRALVARGGVNADSAREAAKSGLAELKDAGGGLLKRLRR